jgi:HK97 family phage portal protein
MSLTRSIERATDFATRTQNISQSLVAKASSGDMHRVIADTVNGGMSERREDIGTAAAQFSHFRNLVYTCVNLISQRISGQTINVASDRAMPGGPSPRGTKSFGENCTPLDQHPLLDLLAAPNSLMSGAALLYATTASLELAGRALWWIITAPDGGQTILPVPVTWIEKSNTDRTVWTIRVPGTNESRNIPGDEVCYFFRPNPADPWGHVSPLSAIAESVVTAQKILDSQYKTFSRMMPSHAVVIGEQPVAPGMSGPALRPHLTPEQRQQLYSSISAAYSGLENSGRPIILDGLISRIERLSLTPDELGYLDSSKLTRESIMMAYNVPDTACGLTSNANRASSAVSDSHFVSNKINPLIALLSDAMTRHLAPRFAKDGERLTVWITPAKARDEEMSFRHWQFASTQGFVSGDEYRKVILNLPPREPEEKEAAVTDVAMTALNGAQISSLVTIAQMVGSGELTREAARAIIAASFPTLSDQKIDAIVDALEVSTTPDIAALTKAMNPYTLRRVSER